MLSERTIPKKKDDREFALDHEQLYVAGLEHVQRLASRIWTDYNVHDPGITTLELLCYALTDLSYRASFPVQDLLSSQTDDPEDLRNQFFTARKILTNRPYTLLDYRKLLIDLKGVKNAWLRPTELTYYADTTKGELFGPAIFLPDGIMDLPAFSTKIKNSSDPVSKFLAEHLSIATLKLLTAYDGTGSDIELQNALIRELNQIIQGNSIYDANRFAAVTLSTEVQTLLKQLADTEGVVRTNRLLLEDTYPELSKSQLLREKSTLPEIANVKLAGLYDVIIEYMDDITTPAAKQKCMKTVRETLQKNRNLCEDFVNFSEVETESFLLCAELELQPDADTVEVQAQILFQVQNYLAPAVPNYSLTEMLERKKPDGSLFNAEEIFEGPELFYGFIDDFELANADLRSIIRLSDIISIIMDIPGVLAIRDIVINSVNPVTSLENKWSVPITPKKKALLDREKTRLVLYKRNMPVIAKTINVKQRYQELVKKAKAKTETLAEYDFELPRGKYRQPQKYYSFQNHFPSIYGLSEFGLSGGSDQKREALSYQLKAYLLFYDQVMANYFAQLSHVKDLLSVNSNIKETYFYQVVDSFAKHNKIYASTDMSDLQEAADDEQIQIERRNRFLDHLIARFAERFNDFVNIMYSAFDSSAGSLINYRLNFLKAYPSISSQRALAYDYKAETDLWETENVSGLEKRLAKLLGIPNINRRNLSNITYDEFVKIEGNTNDGFRFRILKKNTNDVVLQSTKTYSTKKLAKKELQEVIRSALLPSGYKRKIKNGKHIFSIINLLGVEIARHPESFASEELMNQKIEVVMEYFRENYSDEGMYVIENILLRTEQEKDPFLSICPNPACVDCAEKDPYSYRIHVILPAYSSRFSKMHFRRYAEEIIRSETPAHILPKICWISAEDMATFEKNFRNWIYLKAGAEKTQRTKKLTDFIDVLFKVKSVFPIQKLHECEAGEDQPKFIIGQSSLGSMNENDDQ